jgi:acetoin utilization deacetylase AcuC-like enzyme
VTRAGADLAIFIAGADPFEGDRLGRLKVTKAGLAERDRIVFERCEIAGLPLAIVMGGGYAKNVADTVDIQFATVQAASVRARRNGHWKEGSG